MKEKQNPPSKNTHTIIGLGDVIYFITKCTGIAWIVHKVNGVTGFECGCNERRQRMNSLLAVCWLKWWKKTK
mgnify:CR=1 FL=1|tara:strand:- start:19630 stop:19845 length:216 start_codon:yes stop_codon:yes gene_type:complete